MTVLSTSDDAAAGAPYPGPDHAASQPPWLVSGAFLGRYLVIEDTGCHGAGAAMRAYDPMLQREVMLRAVSASGMSDENRERMLAAVRAMAKLNHSNVVALYDVQVVAGDIVLATQHVPGLTLAHWLSAAVRPWREVIEAFRAAGRGLAAAHAMGVVHGDFRADCAIFGDDDIVRVIGFGLSPQANLLSNPDAALDQYAFCLATWRALSGREPVTGDDADAPPAWPREVRVPTSITAALQRGLARDPRQRWPDMDALLQALAHDPRQQRRRLLTAGSVALAIGMSSVAWAAWHAQRLERCSGAQAQLDALWDPQRREAVRQALLDTQVGYAREVWGRVAPQLDAFATTWVETHVEACKATSVRGEQSPAALDLRMACLHRAKVELQVATDLLARADAQVVENAYRIVGRLPALERCSDLEALKDDVPPPHPSDAAAVEAVRVALAQAIALSGAGKYAEAHAALLAVAERAQIIGYGPLQSEVGVALGYAQDNVGHFEQSEQTLKRALRSSLRWRQERQAYLAGRYLVDLLGSSLGRPAEAFAHAVTAKALVDRLDVASRGYLHNSIGNALLRQGRDADAEAEYRGALALWETPDELATVMIRHNLTNVLSHQGRYVEAEQESRRVLELREGKFGADHPDTILSRINVGASLAMQGRHQEALEQVRGALETAVRSLGLDHWIVGMCRQHLAFTLHNLGQLEAAQAEAEAALELTSKLYGPDHQETVSSRHILANLKRDGGQLSEAEVDLRLVLAAWQRLDVPYQRAHAHNDLGQVLLELERLHEAELQLGAALALRQELLGKHPMTAQSLNNLGVALARQERYVEAEEQHRACLALWTELSGDVSLEVSEARAALAQVLEKQGRVEEALEFLRDAIAVREELRGAEHAEVEQLRDRLARLERQMSGRGRSRAWTKVRGRAPEEKRAAPPEPVDATVGT